MKKIKLLWIALVAMIWIGSAKAQNVNTLFQDEATQLTSATLPTGWSVQAAASALYSANASATIAANSIQTSASAQGGNRGMQFNFPASNTYSNASNIVTFEADWVVTSRYVSSKNGFGFMVDASASSTTTPVHIFGLYTCGSGSYLYLTNYRTDSIPFTGTGSFNFASQSATASVVDGAGYNLVNRVYTTDAKTTSFPFATGKTYHIKAVLNFGTKKITSLTISDGTNTASLTNSGAGFNFFDQTANNTNIAKVSIFNSRSSKYGNGGSITYNTAIQNLQIYKTTSLGTLSTNGAQCVSTGVTLSTTATSATGETLYWQDTNTGTSTTYQDTRNVTASGNNYLRMLTTNTNTAYNVWSAASSALAATVYPLSVGGSAAAVDATVPVGSHTNINLTGNTGTIQWYVSTNGTDYSTVSGGSGATTATYTTPNLTAGTYYYKALVQSGSCSTQFSTPTTVNAVSSSAVVNVSTTALSSYGKVANGSTTASKSFTVSGTDLASNITITAPTGYQLSTDNSSFSPSPAVLTQSGGAVSSTTIYVRFAPAAVQSYSYTGTNGISIVSTNVSTQYIDLSGTGIAAEPATQASVATVSALAQTSLTLGWTVGSGAKSIVIYSTNSDVATANIPVDGTTYTAGTEIASGYKILYVGTGNSAGLSGLTAGTTYYFAVFTFDDGGLAGSENYNTASPAALTQATAPNSSATDYFKTSAAGRWDAVGSWLSSADGSAWHVATMIPQASATSTLVTAAANPITIGTDILPSSITMENGAKLKISRVFGNANWTFATAIAGTGSISLQLDTVPNAKPYIYAINPAYSGVSTVNYILNPLSDATGIRVIGGGLNFNVGFGGSTPAPTGTQFNVTTTKTIGQGFPLANDTYLQDSKLNLSDYITVNRATSQSTAVSVYIGELSSNNLPSSANAPKLCSGIAGASNRTVSYYIGSLNTDATYAGQFTLYGSNATYSPIDIHKTGTGTWTLTGTAGTNHYGNFFVDNGKVVLNGAIGTSIVATVASGAILDGTNISAGTATLNGSATVNGTLQGSVSITGATTISSTGILTGTHTFGSTLALAGTTNLTVTDFTSNYNVITTTGAVSNGGTLNITVNASVPAPQTAIKLINAGGGCTGSFSVVNIIDGLGNPIAGYTYNATTGYLTYLAALTLQTSNMSVTSSLQTSVSLTWTAGDGAKNLVLYSTNSDVATAHLPVNATLYTVGSEIATGYIVGSISSGNTATITGLSASTTYHFAVFSFNDYNGSGMENYLTTSPATASTTTPANSNATDYFKSNVSGDWSTATNWLSSTDNSSWHLASMEPQDGAASILVTAATPMTVTSTTMALPFSMEDNATVSLKPGNATSYNGNFTASNVITGSGNAITLKNYTAATTGSSSYTVNCAPIITNISTLNYELDIAGAKGSSSTRWSTTYQATVPDNTHVNVTSTVGSAGFTTGTDAILSNAKLNLGASVRLMKGYNANSSAPYSTIAVGELTGNASATVEGTWVSGRTLQYNIGGLNTDATFDGTFKNYAQTADSLSIVKKGTGNWTLTANSTLFTKGSVTVDAGTVTLASGAALGTVAVNVSPSASLVVSSGATVPSVITISTDGSTTGTLNIPDGSTIASLTFATTASAISPAYGTTFNVINATNPATITYTDTVVPNGYRFDALTGTLSYGFFTKLNDQANSKLTIYPTLTNGIIHVQGGNGVSAEVVNLAGQVVKVANLTSSTTINLSDLSIGAYFVKVRSIDGSVSIQKVVLQK